jgi:hypothetical protein
MWMVAANILSRQSRTADKGFSSSSGLQQDADNFSSYKASLLRNVRQDLGLDLG